MIQHDPWLQAPVSRWALGCMHLGGSWASGAEVTEDALGVARRALTTALAAGINCFDHADIYCRGRSEAVFGQLMAEMGLHRAQYWIQTKAGIRFAGDGGPDAPRRYDFSPEHLRRSLEASLERLQTDYVDCFILHRPDLLAEPEAIAQLFRELKAEGKVRHFGVSNHTPGQIQLLQAALDEPLVLHQVELNLLKSDLLDSGVAATAERRPMPGTTLDGLLDFHRLHHLRTQAWAPLAYGYLSGRPVGEEFRQGDQVRQRIAHTAQLVGELSQHYGEPAEAVVLAWLLRHPAGIQPVVGTRDPGRLLAAARARHVHLTREDWYRLYLAGRGQDLP